ncbi:uncharacterized protein LOC144871540 isoform X2 [Branchiostoma floridae x Branchiostoma japonicum]
MEKLLQEQEAKRQHTLQQLSDKLTFQLQGDLTEEEINRIMANHERELGAAMLAWEESKGKQAAELREQLARRRKDKEAALRKLHASQCEQAGIPEAPESKDNTEDRLQHQELVLDTLMAEENAGLARAQMDHSSELEADRQQKMTDNINSVLDDLVQQGALSEEESERIQKQLIDREAALKASMEKRKNLQASLMRGRMADRKRRRIQQLKDRQGLEREAKMHPTEDEEDSDSVTKLSEVDHQSTIQDSLSARFDAARKLRQARKRGRKDQDDGSGKRQRLLEAGEDVAELDRRHARELEALEAQIAAEEAEHLRDISRSLDEEHTNSLKDTQKDILKDLSSKHGVDAVRQQEIMDRFCKDQENLEYMSNIRKERQTQDLQAKLAARKVHKIADAMRQAEEDAAKRFIDEQEKQLQQVAQLQQQEASAGLVIPQLAPGDSLEEQDCERSLAAAIDSGKSKFIEEDDDKILDYALEFHKMWPEKGKKIWRNFVRYELQTTEHTAESIRKHFRRHLWNTRFLEKQRDSEQFLALPAARRNRYLKGEDKNILMYIQEHPEVEGDILFKQMEQHKVAPRHTWKSMKDRYHNFLKDVQQNHHQTNIIKQQPQVLLKRLSPRTIEAHRRGGVPLTHDSDSVPLTSSLAQNSTKTDGGKKQFPGA